MTTLNIRTQIRSSGTVSTSSSRNCNNKIGFCNRSFRNASSRNIRERYLYSLGIKATANLSKEMANKPIVAKPNEIRSTYTYRSSINDRSQEIRNSVVPTLNSSARSMPRNIPNKKNMRTSEKQKEENNKPLRNSPKCVSNAPTESNTQKPTLRNSSSNVNKKKKRSVSFDETVLVLTIPSKDSYSDRVRKYLWTQRQEMMENTARNAIEFASENWDWRQVADDVEFYICPITGEKIHPCHACYVPDQISNHRPLNRNPFFVRNRQASLEWQRQGRRGYNINTYQ